MFFKRIIQKILILLIGLLPVISVAQFTIAGKVSDKDSGELLSGATILFDEGESSTTTDASGIYTITNVEAGKHQMEISFVGYKTIVKNIDVNGNMNLNFRLKYTAIMSDEVIVQATRAQEKSPTTYAVVGKQQITENNIGQDLPYILQISPSVVTTSDAGAGVGYTGIRIRGTDITRINVTMNGVPVNDPESHNVYFVDLPDLASSVDNIQIQRGVGTSTNGAAAFGASINIQTTKVNPDPYAEINSMAGSFNTFKNTLNFGSGLIKGKWAFDGRLSNIQSDGYIECGWSNLNSFYISGGYYGEKDIFKVIVTSGWEKTYQAWYGTPKDSLKTNRRYNPSGAMYDELGNIKGYYDNQTDNYRQTYYQLHYAHQFNKYLNLSSAFFYTKGKGYYESFRNAEAFIDYGFEALFLENDTSNLIDQKWLDNDFYGFNLAFNYNKSRMKVTVGGGWNYYDGDHYGYIIWSRYANNSFIDKPWYENKGKKTDFNIFGKVSYELNDKLNLFADLQYRGIQYDMTGVHDDLRDLTQSHSYNFINPKGGIYYELNDQHDLFASVAVAKREPSRSVYRDADENQDVKPERLIDYELGYKLQHQKVSIETVVFYMDYKDQLVNTGEINNVGEYNKINVPDSYRAGIELVAGIQLAKKVKWEFNATYSQNEILNMEQYFDEYDENWEWVGQVFENIGTTDISFSPDFIAGSNISWEAFKNFKTSFVSRYVGKQFIDNTSNAERSLDAYFVNDLKFFYTINTDLIKSIDLFLSLNNIFAEEYVSNAWVYPYYNGGQVYNDFGYYPQAKFHLMGGVSLKF